MLAKRYFIHVWFFENENNAPILNTSFFHARCMRALTFFGFSTLQYFQETFGVILKTGLKLKTYTFFISSSFEKFTMLYCHIYSIYLTFTFQIKLKPIVQLTDDEQVILRSLPSSSASHENCSEYAQYWPRTNHLIYSV